MSVFVFALLSTPVFAAVPELDPITTPQSVDEGVELAFTATAMDEDLPADTLTFTLSGTVPAGAAITAGGDFAWTPSEAQGGQGFTFDVVVTDLLLASDSQTITVNVGEVNVAPILGAIGNRTVNELATLSFTATATDTDLPVNTLTFSLDAGAPAGATINPTTGAFSWTPTEAEGPGSFPITVRVTDNGTPNLDDSELITVTVDEVNVAPVLGAIGNRTVEQESPLTFTATANDNADIPANTLTFSLDGGAPAGATINPTTGAFSWTPTTSQGPGDFPITVRVTDNGAPNLDDSELITVTVSEEPNVAPVLGAIGNRTVNELATLSFTATATDANVPAQTLTFSLDGGAPAGATINPTTGAFSWTPTEAEGPGSFPITVRVTDNGTPNLDDSELITVTVDEVNVAPVLGAIGNRTVEQESPLTFTATANDNADIPANTLTFSLDGGAPAGATINPTTGAFSWTPTTSQGPGDFPITVRVTDNGAPNLDDSELITVTVSEEPNVAPVLGAIGNRTVNELATLSFTATATDANVPAQTLTFSLDGGAPAGATINPTTGAFSWTPTEAEGPGSFPITVRVTDNGTPNLDDSELITVTVDEVNVAPVLGAIGNRTVEQESPLTFTATANDNADIPANTLTFSLDGGAPAGATINPTTGAFSWTPTTSQGPGDFPITVRVTDNGAPNLDDSELITVTVSEEPNVAPVLGAIGNRTVNELATLSFTATATDANVPAQTLTFSLDGGAPAGATINPTTGAFSWTPTEAEGPGSFPITVRVTDNGTPNLDDSELITVTVDEVNVAPVLGAIGNRTVEQESPLTFTATANDNADIPANTLTFSLDGGAPAGATINPTTGAFSWTPTTSQGPGDFPITVRVTDNGAPNLDDSELITVTVSEEPNVAPVLGAIGNRTVNELATLSFTATATDANVPAQTLTFSLDGGAPAGATINPTTGAFSWTPTEAEGPGSFPITVRVTDNGTPNLDDSELITVTVDEVNVAPVLGAIGNRTVNELVTLSFTATATDADLPADTLTFSLGGTVPAGAAITAGGNFTWTPSEAQGPSNYTFNVVVTDDGTGTLSDSETITVTVNEANAAPVLGVIGNQTIAELAELAFTATATDADLPADTLTFSLGGTVPAGAAITAGGNFTWTPSEAQGPNNYTFNIVVTDDGTGTLSDNETITVRVDEVNAAPVLGVIGNQTIDELTELAFTATATDADLPADTLTFSLGGAVPAGAAITAGGNFTWTPSEAQGPSNYTFNVVVTDDGTGTLSDSETITVTVNEVNEAPTANDDDFDVTEGGSTVAGLNVLGNDTDPDETIPVLTAQLVAGPTLDPAFVLNSDGTFSYTHDGSETLTDSFTYQACDSDLLCSTQPATVTITVDSVNDPPVIEAQLPLSTAEETPLLVTLTDLTVTDVDSDPATFVLTVQDGVDYTRVDNTITPDVDFNGDLTVPVTVSDGTDVSDVFNLTVTVTGVNDAPVITGQVGLSTPEDASLTIQVFDLTITDVDSDPATFVLAVQDGANYTRVDNTITPVLDFNGSLSVPVTVSDDLLTSAIFVMTVDVTAENDMPVVALPIEDQIAIEGAPFSLNVFANFTDADGDILQFAASGLPASGNLSIDPQTGLLSGTPRIEDARDNDPYIIIVSATDSLPGTIPAEDTFELNISALDRANVSLNISVTPDPAMLNDELRWTFTAANLSGPQNATNVELTGSFVGSGLVISSASVCTIDVPVGQVTDFTCMLGGLPVGGSASVVLTSMTSASGDVVAFGTAASTDPLPLDPVLDDNSSQVAVGVAEAFSNGAVQQLGNATVRSVATGDVNGDGAADVVVGTVAGQPVQIYLSGGFRDFAASPIVLPDFSAHEGIAVADFDRNGTLDLVVANGGGQADIVYGNDGVGNFTPIATLGPTFSQDVAVGDFNNDGLPDIVIATILGNPVYLGDGFGGFVLHDTLGTANSLGVAVGKFNGDALDDVVFANAGSDSRVWVKNSGAGFSAGALLPVGDAAAVVVGEFGGSTRPDLAFARVPAGPGDVPSNPVLINDGLGGFGSPVANLGVSPTNDIHAGDVNRDGLTDLVFVNSSGVHQIWTGTGVGFQLYREQIVDSNSVAGVLTELGMTDVANPGGVDLAMGGDIVAGLGIFLNDGFGNLGRGDAVSPVLTLIGEVAVSVPSGSPYIDGGATADDNIDGDISRSIVVTNNVNTAVVGEYAVTYNVVDFAGNIATPITRTVTVTPAAGTGGGGGGALSLLLLFALMCAGCLTALQPKRAIIRAGDNLQ